VSNVLNEEKRQQVIALGRLGWPVRRIQQETGVRRETASAYLSKFAGVTVRSPRGWGKHAPTSKLANGANQVSPDFGGDSVDSATSNGTPSAGFGPIRYRDGPHMTAFSDQVHKGPAFLALLELTDLKAGQLRSAEPAAEQKGEHGSIAFAAQRVPVRRIEQEACLLRREPIASAMAQLLHSFDTTNARNHLRAKEPLSEASYVSRLMAVRRTLMVAGARRRLSRCWRYARTTERVNASLGSEQYHVMNSSIACR
jgi:hypothetical protein